MNVFAKPSAEPRLRELCRGEKTKNENKRKNSTVMKRPYDAMKPLGRLLGVFALLCLCCSSDPATPDAPAEEGGGI